MPGQRRASRTVTTSQSVTAEEGPGPISRAVTEALTGTTVPTSDGGAAALAKRYAELIDRSAPSAVYAKALRTVAYAMADVDDPNVADAFRKIADALAAHSVASDLGPKLLAALTALGMTPAARGAKGGAPDGGPTVAGKLDQFTARRTGQHAS